MRRLSPAEQVEIATTCARSRRSLYSSRFTYEDAISEAWLGIQRAIERFPAHGGTASIEAWAGSYAVWAIRRAVGLDRVGCGMTNERTIRKLARTPIKRMADVTRADGHVREPLVEDEPTLDDCEDFLAAWKAIKARVKPRQSQALELRFVRGLSLDATAKVMGISSNTVGSHVAHARAKLRALREPPRLRAP